MILYHYTDRNGYNGITSSGKLLPSRDTLSDAAGGEGWYFSDLPPNSCLIHIKKQCYGKVNVMKYTDYYISVDIPREYIREIRPNAYVVPIDYPINFNFVSHGQTGKCPQAPCSNCPEYTEENLIRANNIGDFFAGLAIVAAGAALAIGVGYLLVKIFDSFSKK